MTEKIMSESNTKRKGIFLSFHQLETLFMLTPEQQEKLLLACYAYHKGEEPDLSDVKVAFAFKAFKPDFDAATAHYQKVCKSRRAAADARWSSACGKQNDANACKCTAPAYQEQVQEQDIKKIHDTPIGVSVAAAGDDAGKDKAVSEDETMGNGLPPCPHGEIVALYHEILPELPRVKVWEGARRTALQARWRESLARLHIRDKPHGLDYWRRYFSYVRQCPLLMGQVTGRDGRQWHADLPWLLKAENYAKVIEGRYKSTEAAQ